MKKKKRKKVIRRGAATRKRKGSPVDNSLRVGYMSATMPVRITTPFPSLSDIASELNLTRKERQQVIQIVNEVARSESTRKVKTKKKAKKKR